jgi:hypothetical protein
MCAGARGKSRADLLEMSGAPLTQRPDISQMRSDLPAWRSRMEFFVIPSPRRCHIQRDVLIVTERLMRWNWWTRWTLASALLLLLASGRVGASVVDGSASTSAHRQHATAALWAAPSVPCDHCPGTPCHQADVGCSMSCAPMYPVVASTGFVAGSRQRRAAMHSQRVVSRSTVPPTPPPRRSLLQHA